MLYTFFITIVFIAELIITTAIITNLLKCDRFILSIDKAIEDSRPDIRDISQLGNKISEQLVILTQDSVNKFKLKNKDMLLKLLNKLLIGLVLWKINSKTIKKFRKSKFGKTLSRGLSLLENMV